MGSGGARERKTFSTDAGAESIRTLYGVIERDIPGIFSQDYDVIHHYTDLDGLVGILGSKGFWLSDARFMNDSEELINCRMIAAEVMRDLLPGVKEAAYREVVAEAKRNLERNAGEKVYLSSFCLDGDLLEQWRAYALNGKGVSIGFDLTGGARDRFFQKLPALALHKVIYDDARKRKIIEIIIETRRRSFNADGARDVGEHADALTGMVNYFSCFFKNQAFATEREVRLVAAGDASKRFKNLHFRVGKGTVIPYVRSDELLDREASGEDEKSPNLPLSRVVVGPAANQDLILTGLREFFQANGYDPGMVVKSRVPYRG